MNHLTRRSQGGFTLVELLVVIVIIGILAALIVPAVMGAKNTARRAAIISEIGQLDMAMQDYKSLFNEYPPDFSSFSVQLPSPDRTPVDVRRHMSGAFPRYTGQFYGDLRAYNIDVDNKWSARGRRVRRLDPAEALVFWLGGLSIGPGKHSSKLGGFSRNPSQPFEGQPLDGSGRPLPQRLQGVYDFDPLRLVDQDDDGWYEYVPSYGAGGIDQRPPYVYFHHRSYTAPPSGEAEDYARYPKLPTSAWGRCVPYRADPAQVANEMGKGWVNPQKFQIISAGLDGQYGAPAPKYYPSGEGYDLDGLDNLTNFSTSTLENAIP